MQNKLDYINSLPTRVAINKEETKKDFEERKEKIMTRKKYWETEWNQELYFVYINQESQPTMGKVISLFVKVKGYTFENYNQLSPFFKRNLRAAKDLQHYSLDRIEKTMKYLDETADYKWTLETVSKFILENIDIKKDEKPIIVLKNGEKIYEIARLKILEKANKIFYKNNKWVEKII